MKRLSSFLLCAVFCFMEAKSQTFYPCEIYSEGTTITTEYKRSKPGLPIRMSAGITLITPFFEGDLWDEDSKGAVEYACKLMSEHLLTACPIRIKVVRNRNQNISYVRTKVNCSSDYIFGEPIPSSIENQYDKGYFIPVATAKRMEVRGLENGLTNKSNTIYDSYDAEIQLSPSDIFSTSLDGTVEAGKYDLVTVILRELAKALGMVTNFTQTSANTLEIYHQTEKDGNPFFSITPYAFRHTEDYGPQYAYNYATSGNAVIGYEDSFETRFQTPLYIYSPLEFNAAKSLLYFKPDENNLDTKLLQPDLPKGTAIHDIGYSFLRVLNYAFWKKMDILVGIGQEGYSAFASLDPVVKSPGIVTFGSDNLRSSSSASNTALITDTVHYSLSASSASLRSSSTANDGYSAYYLDGTNDPVGWYLYLLKKDGSLDLVAQQSNTDASFSFDFSNLTNVDEYARTSDGYLRARLNWNKYAPVIPGAVQWGWNEVMFFFVDYKPEKPVLAEKKNFIPLAYGPASSKNVKLAYSKMTGVTQARMLMKEYDGEELLSSISIPVDVNAGTYAAQITDMKKTFQLISYNHLGEERSNIVEILPLRTIPRPDIAVRIIDDGLYQLTFIDQYTKAVMTTDVKSVKAVNVLNTSVSTQINNNNVLDIRNMPQGVYGVNVVDENNEIYTVKIIK